MSRVSRIEAVSAERVARTLAISGRRMFEGLDGVWRIQPGADRRRRPVLQAPEQVARRMIAQGELVEAAGGGWVLADAAAAPGSPEAPRPALDARAADQAGREPGSRGPGFPGLALKAGRGEGPLTLREAAAGRRLIADAEASLRLPGLTMNWDAVPSDGSQAGAAPGAGGPRGGAALAAANRLQRLRREAGARAFDLAWAACVDGLPLAVLERRFGLASRSAGRHLSGALETMADAYER